MGDWTDGPWEAAERGAYGDFDGNSRVIIGNDRRIAVVQHHGTQEDEANTNLIDAAPELYEALKAAQHALRSYQYGNSAPALAEEIADSAQASLAKAQGQPLGS